MITRGMKSKFFLLDEAKDEGVNPDNYRSEDKVDEKEEYHNNDKLKEYQSQKNTRNQKKSKAQELLIQKIIDENGSIDDQVNDDLPDKVRDVVFRKDLGFLRVKFKTPLRVCKTLDDRKSVSPEDIENAFQQLQDMIYQSDCGWSRRKVKHIVQGCNDDDCDKCGHDKDWSSKGWKNQFIETEYDDDERNININVTHPKKSRTLEVQLRDKHKNTRYKTAVYIPSENQFFVADGFEDLITRLFFAGAIKTKTSRVRRDNIGTIDAENLDDSDEDVLVYFESKNMEGSDFTEKEVRKTAKYAMVLDYYYDGHYALQHVYNGQKTKSAEEEVKTYRRKGYNIRDPLYIDKLVEDEFDVDVGAIVYDPKRTDDSREFFFLDKSTKEEWYRQNEIVCDLFQLADIDEKVWQHAKKSLLKVKNEDGFTVGFERIKELLPWDSPKLTRYLLDYLDFDYEENDFRSDELYQAVEDLQVNEETRKEFLKQISGAYDKLADHYHNTEEVLG